VICCHINAVRLYSYYLSVICLVFSRSNSYSIKINQSGRFIMDLSNLQPIKFRDLVKKSLFISAAIFLTACASAANKPDDESALTAKAVTEDTMMASESTVDIKEKVIPDLPLNAEIVYYVLMAEVAGQRGEIGVAADLYNRAAESVDSPKLAGRSTQVANFTRNKERISRALERWADVSPDDPTVHVMQFPFLIIEGKTEEAVNSVDMAIELSPENTEAYLAQASENMTELGVKPEQALHVIKQLQVYKQHHVEADFAYARLAAFYKQYDDSLAHIDRVLTQQPNREDAVIIKAELLQRLGKSEAALALIAPLAKQEGASSNVQFVYAKLLGENGKSEQAKKAFKQLLQDDPQNQDAVFALGLLALEAKDAKTAKTYFSQLASIGDSGKQAAYFMGLSEELSGNYESALIWFASVPNDSVRFNTAQTRYVTLLADKGNVTKARMHLKLLRKENPSKALEYYLLEASFLRDREQYQQAFDLYSEALVTSPTNIDLLYGRAMTAELMDKIDVLEADLRLVLDTYPDNPMALNALGYTLADRTERYAEALDYIQKAIAISPNDPYFLDSLGWVYYRMGRLDDAIRYLTQAATLKPDAEFYAHLGEVLWVANKPTQANAAWQAGLKKDPDNALLKETMQRLAR
jgi:tetratricopeptide (TPR) repeat protein